MSDNEYQIMMPFVTVTSVGGIHDDRSYVAGFQMGFLDTYLAQAAALNLAPRAQQVASENLPQVDLLAMKHGFTTFLSDEDYPVEGWTLVMFGTVGNETDDAAEGVSDAH